MSEGLAEKEEKVPFPNCRGCHWGGEPHPSQRYHMGEGGCLQPLESMLDEEGKIKES
jgi:hypothetical protein